MEKSQQIQEAILTDSFLQSLYSEKALIYSLQPITGIMKEEEFEVTQIIESEHPLLSIINKNIENRINQIRNKYK